MVYLNPTLNILSKSIRLNGKKILRDFIEIEKLQGSIKGTRIFAEKAFKKIKKTLFLSLNDIDKNFNFVFPDSEIVDNKTESFWIINPIDGYLNFSRGIPYFSISVAIKKKSEIISSLVYNPINDEMFTASIGKGAYLNDSRIRVSSQTDKKNSIINIYDDKIKTKDNKFNNIFAYERKTGCSTLDLCCVASGKADAFTQHFSDIEKLSSGILIVKEAGGIVNIKDNTIIASNLTFKDEIKEIIIDL